MATTETARTPARTLTPTGTAVAPLPRASANLTPLTRVAGKPQRARVSAGATRPVGVASATAGPRAARDEAYAPATSTATRTAAEPSATASASNAKPGCGSRSRANPIGLSGERAAAIPAASAAAGSAIAAARATPTAPT